MATGDAVNIQFDQAYSFVNYSARHVFLTGKAGTGKTTFLRHVRDNTSKKMAIVAPTGVAAINAGGVTMHSFFHLPMGLYVPTEQSGWNASNAPITNQHTLFKNIRFNKDKIKLLNQLELLVIDEVSMLRADMLDAIDTILRHFRNNPRPFGGLQVLYIGDLFQLPPVTGREEWEIMKEHYRSPFFFDAHVIRQAFPVYIELQKVYRQRDPVFVNLLNNIRNNRCTPADLQLLQQHYNPAFVPAAEDNYIMLTTHNFKADAVNQQALQLLPGESHTFTAEITGEFSEKAFPAEKTLQLKAGAQIMFIKNDKGESRRYYNGKIGVIKRIDAEGIYIHFPGEPAEFLLETEKWKNIRYDYSEMEDKVKEEELGSFSQYPIRLAWAVTIHKSQGLTFDKAVIDAGASFAPGQVYVALSRLTSLQGLVLHSIIHPHHMYADDRVMPYIQQSQEGVNLAELLLASNGEFVKTSLVQCFNWSLVVTAWQDLYDSFATRQMAGKPEEVLFIQLQLRKLVLQQDTARKFCRQLEFLLATGKEDNYRQLQERTQSAAEYFEKLLTNDIITPLLSHIKDLAVKAKQKKYIDDLQSLWLTAMRKKETVQKAVQLTSGLVNNISTQQLLDILNAPSAIQGVVRKSGGGSEGAGADKKPSRLVTLEMFLEGQLIEDVAAARAITVTTAESHLLECIRMKELRATDMVSPEKIAVIEATLDELQATFSGPVKEKLGDDYSYTEIRAVIYDRQAAAITEE
ncbi:Helicase [Filimonas lacunae]|uniref:Helicase n=1 Tax=Filimonas lacunae TaxID=477680 RepID=A0A173MN71_9BACT|nr:helix-turn-helix domain-containing protein [Filimonas lacunae]BAV08828.1 related to 5' to 3' DNA helicase [Filimonas lacunae]SIS62403.1 Helicase [Filimonas lacunae]